MGQPGGAAEVLRSQKPGATEEEEIRQQASHQRVEREPGGYRDAPADERGNRRARRAANDPRSDAASCTGSRTTLPIEAARWMAAQIPGARFVELSGGPHFPFYGDAASVLDEIQAFAVGISEERPWDEAERDRVLATILFTDIVGSTENAVELGDQAWANLERHHAVVRTQLDRFRGRELDTAGDGFFAAFDGPIRAIRCATQRSKTAYELGLEVRAGLHTGECETIGEKLGGIAVNIGARVAAKAQAGEILVSSTVKDLVAGSELAFHDRGRHKLKGIPGEWHLYAVAR